MEFSLRSEVPKDCSRYWKSSSIKSQTGNMHTFKTSEGKTIPKRPLSGHEEGSRKRALDNLSFILLFWPKEFGMPPRYNGQNNGLS